MAYPLTEADLEQRTDALLKDLEAAKDPVAYRQRYHQSSAPAKNAPSRRRSTAQAPRRSGSRASTYSLVSSSQAFWSSSLLITTLAILMGTLIGSLMSLYLA